MVADKPQDLHGFLNNLEENNKEAALVSFTHPE